MGEVKKFAKVRRFKLAPDANTKDTLPDADAKLNPDEFIAYLPDHKYIDRLTGKFWPADSINSTFGKGASRKLDRMRGAHSMTWVPGLPQMISGKVVVEEGGWIEAPGRATYNRYRPSRYVPHTGDASKAGPWRKHIRLLYPEDQALHLEKWLAWRVQHPEIKINHAIVLGGPTRIGKDTILRPMFMALGEWNVKDITADQAMDTKFNGFLAAVLLRVSEARDFGDKDRYAFYEHTKPWLASPPETLSVADKFIKAHPVFNLVGVIITTNYKTGGIYLPKDDARNYVMWSEMTREDEKLAGDYFPKLHNWLDTGGLEHVCEFLRTLDISGFNPKEPPPQTAAFWEIVNANSSPEQDDLRSVIGLMGNPDALTPRQVIEQSRFSDFQLNWEDRNRRRSIPRELEEVGYVSVHKPNTTGGRWGSDRTKTAIYASIKLTEQERLAAARKLSASMSGTG